MPMSNNPLYGGKQKEKGLQEFGRSLSYGSLFPRYESDQIDQNRGTDSLYHAGGRYQVKLPYQEQDYTQRTFEQEQLQMPQETFGGLGFGGAISPTPPIPPEGPMPDTGQFADTGGGPSYGYGSGYFGGGPYPWPWPWAVTFNRYR